MNYRCTACGAYVDEDEQAREFGSYGMEKCPYCGEHTLTSAEGEDEPN